LSSTMGNKQKCIDKIDERVHKPHRAGLMGLLPPEWIRKYLSFDVQFDFASENSICSICSGCRSWQPMQEVCK
jgi:hypothetical protein